MRWYVIYFLASCSGFCDKFAGSDVIRVALF